MIAYLSRFGAAVLLTALLISTPGRVAGQDVPPFDRDAPPGDPPAVPGPEVDARGPIHEGFAQPGGLPPRAGPVIPKMPPEAIDERPPEVRPEGNVVWVPGYWAYDEDRMDFVWVSGFWRLPPAGRKWVPGYWAQAPGGARWVSGFWADAAVNQVPYYDEPPVPLDNGPSVPAPDESYFYVPGWWAPFDGQWRWSAGFWCAPRAGLVYTPARCLWTPRGFVYCPPFWDRPWGKRGLPFAPVYFRNKPWTRPGWAFRPSYAINPGVALSSLWV